jgi:hypothetical protein
MNKARSTLPIIMLPEQGGRRLSIMRHHVKMLLLKNKFRHFNNHIIAALAKKMLQKLSMGHSTNFSF